MGIFKNSIEFQGQRGKLRKMTTGKKWQLNFRGWKAQEWVVFEQRGGSRTCLRADDFVCARDVSQEAAAHLWQRNAKGSGIGHSRYLGRCRCRAELETELVAILYEVSTHPSDMTPFPSPVQPGICLWSLLSPHLPPSASTAERWLPHVRGSVKLKARGREVKWKYGHPSPVPFPNHLALRQ